MGFPAQQNLKKVIRIFLNVPEAKGLSEGRGAELVCKRGGSVGGIGVSEN